MKKAVVFTVLFATFLGYGQESGAKYRSKKVAVRDAILVDTVGLNPSKFIVKDLQGTLIDSSLYSVDYPKAIFFPSQALIKKKDSLHIDYLVFPEFLTKEYFEFDQSIIVNSTQSIKKLYSLDQSNTESLFTPFNGLTSSGSISRGITIGNNQNAVVNSQLDLQITGKLSDKISIRASIQDANIPTQQGGYTQNLEEFDQIFIELFSDSWNIRAGDIDLQNQNSYFGRFTKKG